ncbi:unnamed protein product [Lactuca saligna]|uniref:Uncharacterized protein n=1 Tax=Lactuca saligna TaxID=75948 RepID=A0AA35VDP3_LACSI|nr:unnamed protein product [Lactuca saligna]
MEKADIGLEGKDIIGHTVKFLVDCKENGEILDNQVPPSIYIVPSAFRDLSPSSFNPRVVSIGPLHKQDENLKGFEVQKKTYLHNLLQRCVPKQTLQDEHSVAIKQMLQECAEKVTHSIQRIKASYGGLTTCSDFELAEMMVIDGCFILEFGARLLELSSKSNKLITQSIMFDLMLIENQIPFFVLENIFECTLLKSIPNASLTTYIQEILKYYSYIFVGNLVAPNVSPDSTHDHLLGLLHKNYQPSKPIQAMFLPDPKGHSAMDLYRAGINFKPNEDQDWGLAMKLEVPSPLFSWIPIFMAIPQIPWLQWPTLKMPIMRINDSTELILRNLIIYEQFSNVGKYITSYVCAMDLLIDTPQDVARLVKSKVLINHLGSNDHAANMINNICKEVLLLEFVYHEQWKDLDAYYNRYWPYTISGLRRTYFKNPWNIIALVAAFVLFALTVVQTIFTVNPK